MCWCVWNVSKEHIVADCKSTTLISKVVPSTHSNRYNIWHFFSDGAWRFSGDYLRWSVVVFFRTGAKKDKGYSEHCGFCGARSEFEAITIVWRSNISGILGPRINESHICLCCMCAFSGPSIPTIPPRGRGGRGRGSCKQKQRRKRKTKAGANAQTKTETKAEARPKQKQRQRLIDIYILN